MAPRGRASRATRPANWPVFAVVGGNGAVGASGRRLETGKIYFSSQSKATVDDFWEPENCPDDFLRVAAAGFELCPTYRLGSEPVPAFLLDRCDRGQDDPDPRPLEDGSIVNYAQENPGMVIIVDKIGARSPHPGLAIHRRESAGQPRRGSECIQMAIINAVRAVRSEEAADAAQKFFLHRSEPIRSLKRVGQILREASVSCGVVRPTHREKLAIQLGQKWEKRKFTFDFVCGAQTGVWIVHLEQRNQVDHAVCIDCERRLIWDSEEECALRLNTESLMMCGGPDCDSIRIKDIRKIVPWNT